MIATLHTLKIHPAPYRAVLDLSKRADYRAIDRPIRPGDLVTLSEWEPDQGPNGGHYTGQHALVQCTHVQEGTEYGIPQGFAIYSWDLMAATKRAPQVHNLETAVR